MNADKSVDDREARSADALLVEICRLVYGTDLATSGQKFREALYAQARDMNGRGVSRQAIRGWFDSNVKIRRPKAIVFLSEFLQTAVRREDLSVLDLKLFDEIMLTAGRNDDRIRPDPAIEARSFLEKNVGVFKILSPISKADDISTRNDVADLFYPSRYRSELDQSYYVIYRYSTEGPSIVKTFMVIKRPIRWFMNLNSFVEFIRGGEGFQRDVARESRGVVARMAHSYYAMGYRYDIPFDPDMDEAEYRSRRQEAAKTAASLEISAIEYSDIGLRRGLFPALALTSAAMNQPVIARTAFLHLGTKESLGSIITHEMINPTELSASEIAKDLIQTIGRLKGINCDRYGSTLHRYVNRDDWAPEGARELGLKIIAMIGNTPAAALRLKTGEAIGAIETFSESATMRPRP